MKTLNKHEVGRLRGASAAPSPSQCPQRPGSGERDESTRESAFSVTRRARPTPLALNVSREVLRCRRAWPAGPPASCHRPTSTIPGGTPVPCAGLGSAGILPSEGPGCSLGSHSQCWPSPSPSPPISMGPTSGWGQLRAPPDCYRGSWDGQLDRAPASTSLGPRSAGLWRPKSSPSLLRLLLHKITPKLAALNNNVYSPTFPEAGSLAIGGCSRAGSSGGSGGELSPRLLRLLRAVPPPTPALPRPRRVPQILPPPWTPTQ